MTRVLSPIEALILTIDGQEHELLVPAQKVVARRAQEPMLPRALRSLSWKNAGELGS